LSLFSDALREARHKVGLSSDELGDKLGYSGRRCEQERERWAEVAR
jgi:ribosome-binding protein aMBF1 (putative translation factor)